MANKTVTTKIPPLTSGPVPLKEICDNLRGKLIDIIDSMIGNKCIIFDGEITGPLGLIVPASVLKEHGVEQMFHLGNSLEEPSTRNVLYLTRANVVNAQLIAKQIKAYNRMGLTFEYAVYFIPRITCLCEKVFEEEGVKGDTSFGDLSLEFIPFEEDVISMELQGCFRETCIEGDNTSLYLLSRAIMNLQYMYGTIPRIMGKGHAAEAVKNMCIKMYKESGINIPPLGKIKRMILLDRAVDLVTPILTQVTYEGIIDEVLGIRNNVVAVEVTERSGASDMKRYVLNSNDSMHTLMRDIPWPHAAPQIREWVQKMRSDWNEIKADSENKTVSEMRDFANRLMQLGSTEMHSNICGPIGKLVPTEEFQTRLQTERNILEYGYFEDGCKYVEELIYSGEDMLIVIRLLCLLSLTNNGFPKKIFDNMRKLFLSTYGYENLILLNNLEKAELIIMRPDMRNIFPKIRNSYSLIYDIESDISNGIDIMSDPKDAGYIFWGYAPITIRLVEMALRQNRPKGDSTDGWISWKGKELEILNILPGPNFDALISEDETIDEGVSILNMSRSEIILVVFIGGVTFSEISALRLVSKLSKGKIKFLIATSRLINGNTFINSLQDTDAIETMKNASDILLS